jgi:hypothetical protein|tara:strand:- start:1005 stop:1262 length:258 start_codon:yes stop_codon:yes gene_type:complete
MRAQDIIRALLDVLDQESKVIDVPGEPPSRFKQILSQLNRQHSNSPDEKYLSSTDAAYPDGDDLHKSKQTYKPVAGGDNPMARKD